MQTYIQNYTGRELAYQPYEYFVKENGKALEYSGSEWRPWKLEVIKQWIDMRDELTYVDNYVEGNWERIDIKKSHSKYGTNYIYLERTKKLWRVNQTIDEFYN